MRPHLAPLTVACFLVWLAVPIGAYWTNGPRWTASTAIVMHLQQGAPSGALIDGSTDWNSVTEGALGTWNGLLNGVSFRVARNSTETVALRNNINNVAWADDIYGESFGDAVAITNYLFRGTVMVEADVLFDRARSWNSYRGNLTRANGTTVYDLRRVALHEFGHVLGLGHPDDHGQSVVAVMNSHISNTDSLRDDDIDGVRAIYGTAAPSSTPPSSLTSGTRLLPGQSILSPNARYRLVYQGDGNLVLYDDASGVARWSSGTAPSSGGQAALQADGNFVVYDAQGTALWSTGTSGNVSSVLAIQSDGNLVLYRADGVPLWYPVL